MLLTLTTASSYVPLGIGNTLINGAIALLKVALIVLCFMHVSRANAAVRFAAGAALLFLFFLAFLSFGDFLTRPNHPAHWQAPIQPFSGTATRGAENPRVCGRRNLCCTDAQRLRIDAPRESL
jgi:caa(3)-type oxidase subunit IV